MRSMSEMSEVAWSMMSSGASVSTGAGVPIAERSARREPSEAVTTTSSMSPAAAWLAAVWVASSAAAETTASKAPTGIVAVHVQPFIAIGLLPLPLPKRHYRQTRLPLPTNPGAQAWHHAPIGHDG